LPAIGGAFENITGLEGAEKVKLSSTADQSISCPLTEVVV
jgi:hypothetical protein